MCSVAAAIVGGSLFGLGLFFATVLLYTRNLKPDRVFSCHDKCTARSIGLFQLSFLLILSQRVMLPTDLAHQR